MSKEPNPPSRTAASVRASSGNKRTEDGKARAESGNDRRRPTENRPRKAGTVEPEPPEDSRQRESRHGQLQRENGRKLEKERKEKRKSKGNRGSEDRKAENQPNPPTIPDRTAQAATGTDSQPNPPSLDSLKTLKKQFRFCGVCRIEHRLTNESFSTYSRRGMVYIFTDFYRSNLELSTLFSTPQKITKIPRKPTSETFS